MFIQNRTVSCHTYQSRPFLCAFISACFAKKACVAASVIGDVITYLPPTHNKHTQNGRDSYVCCVGGRYVMRVFLILRAGAFFTRKRTVSRHTYQPRPLFVCMYVRVLLKEGLRRRVRHRRRHHVPTINASYFHFERIHCLINAHQNGRDLYV